MRPEPPVLVSACLAGTPCRYDGAARPDSEVVARTGRGETLPLCAEVLGGLPTPRPAAEIVGGDGDDVLDGQARIRTADGQDLTDEFVSGARVVADRAEAAGVLQARSPSCGCGTIYDGTHTGTLRAGRGVLAAELARRGITVEDRRGRRAAEQR